MYLIFAVCKNHRRPAWLGYDPPAADGLFRPFARTTLLFLDDRLGVIFVLLVGHAWTSVYGGAFPVMRGSVRGLPPHVGSLTALLTLQHFDLDLQSLLGSHLRVIRLTQRYDLGFQRCDASFQFANQKLAHLVRSVIVETTFFESLLALGNRLR